MAPSVVYTSCATPPFPVPACVFDGHWTVEPVPSVHAVGAAFTRKLVKFWVVPDPSERWTTVIAVLGSLAEGLSALIAASSHLVICTEKILAIVSGDSLSFDTPERLYDTVIGATTVGK